MRVGINRRGNYSVGIFMEFLFCTECGYRNFDIARDAKARLVLRNLH